MKYLRGFFMAWGMFCWIPCPYTKWRQEDRDAQIGMLPLIGACIGGITCLIWWCLGLIGANQMIIGAVLTGAYFLLTGFIHLDGYMDCSDAVMPRHPRMEERRRILKDSHTGAFGAICLVMMIIVVFAAWVSLSCDAEPGECNRFSIGIFLAVIMVFTLSRTAAAISVLKCRPMSTSQYAGAWKGGESGAVAFALIWGALFTAGAIWTSICGSCTGTAPGPGAVAAAAVVTVLAALLTGAFDRSKLGGMNGDISGHMITTSEMFGLLALALLV